MLIDNFKALTIFEKNIKKNYVEYSDLKAILESDVYPRKYYAENYDELYHGNYVSLTEFEDETLIDIVNSSIDVVNEAVQFALLTKKKIYFCINQNNINDLRANYQISITDSTGHEHYGIYGCLKDKNTHLFYNNAIEISNVSPEDIERIHQLSPKEWGNLPIIIKHMKNLDHMFLAKINNDYVGYLACASSHRGYMDTQCICSSQHKKTRSGFLSH